MLPTAYALTPSYVTNPASCPSSDSQFPGQNCSGGLNICGVDTSTSTNVTQCYNNSTISAPGSTATSNTLYTGSLGGGYIIDCFAVVDSAAPYCDNNGAWLCNRSATCYTTKQRDTTCTGAGTYTCGSCRSGYQDCGGDDACEVQTGVTNYPSGANNNYAASCGVQCDTGYVDCDASGAGAGNGCEIQVGSACTTADGAAGTYSGCTCVPTKSYFETGTKSTYATSNPLLWGTQLNGTGKLISFSNRSGEQFAVYNSGAVKVGNFTAGTGTGAGTMRWTGVDFQGFDGTSWLSLTGGAGGALTLLQADARYVRKAGDTMTGSLIVQATMSGRHLIVSQTASFSGALVAAGNATVKGTLSGSRLVVSGHTNISGTLLVLNTITSRRTISGSNLYAAASISGAHLYVATTIGGAGLATCNGSTQKLMYNATTKRFECGTDLNTGGGGTTSTGNVLTIGDARYVRKSGDTMTGILKITKSGGYYTGALLNVLGGMSGRSLYVSGSGGSTAPLLSADSGKGKVGVGTTNPTEMLHVVSSGLSVAKFESSNGNASVFLYNDNGGADASLNASAGRLEFVVRHNGSTSLEIARMRAIYRGNGTTRSGDIAFDTTNSSTPTERMRITATGSVGIGTTDPKAKLDVRGTISGTHLIISGNGAFTGAIFAVGNIATRGTLSGKFLTVQSSATISGALLVKNSIVSKGSLSGSTIAGFNLGSCNGATQKLLYNYSTQKFECGSDQNTGTSYTAGQGLTLNGTAFRLSDTFSGTTVKVLGTLSGAFIHAEKTLSASGMIVGASGALLDSGTFYVDAGNNRVGIGTIAPKTKLEVVGSISGTTLTLSNLRNCDTIDTDSNGNLVCGTDQNAGTGLDQNTADARYVRKSGSTMTGALIIDITGGSPTTLGLNVKNTISGSRLIVSGHTNISGALLVAGGITTRGTLSGTHLTVSRSASISGTLIVKTGITSKGSLSGATFYGAGLGDCTGANQKLLYNVTTGLFSCGTISASGTFSTGNVLTIGDARYVKKSGDTMTGALVLTSRNNYTGAILLKILGVASGAYLHAEKNLTSSGTINAVGNITTRGTLSGNFLTIQSSATISGATLVKGNLSTKGILSGRTLAIQSSATISGATLVKGNLSTKGILSGATLAIQSSGTVSGALLVKSTLATKGILSGRTLAIQSSATISGATLVKGNLSTKGTLSGNFLTVQQSATISGALLVKTGIASKGYLSGSTIAGFNLGSCNSASSRLLYNYSTQKFECGTYATSTFGTGNVLTIGDARYVRKSGDTMTGGLVINSRGSYTGAILLKILGTTSGAFIHAEQSLSSSGILLVTQRTIAGSGALVVRQLRNSTGAYFTTAATGAALLVLETRVSSQTGAALAPHILFGYKGTFDVALYRSSGAILNASGSLAIRGGTGRTLLTLDTESATGATNVFKIISEVRTGLGSKKNNLVYRITASGATFSDSAYSSAGADYAEWFASSDVLAPGEVVCIDILRSNTVKRCSRAADPNVMGIISSHPAFIGNRITGADDLPVPGYVLVGLIGQVPARAVVESGAVIRPGDSLTSASTPGLLRKAKAGESTVGVALEPYDGTQKSDFINVLISRRNQSLTVETVEQKVLESIASMNISDEVSRLVQRASKSINLDAQVNAAITNQLSALDLSAQIEEIVKRRLSGAVLTVTGQLTPEQLADVAKKAAALVGPRSGTGEDLVARALIADLQSQILSLRSALTGGTLNLASLTVARDATIRGSLTVGGTVTLSASSMKLGPIAVSGSEVQIGSLVSTGSLRIIGNITVTGLARFLGDVDVRGELSVSGKQAGIATIADGAASVTVTFSGAFLKTPIVTATSDDFAPWRIRNRTQTGFTIELKEPAENTISFSWFAVSSADPLLTHAAGTETGPTPFPVNALGQPVSSDTVWNSCIQGRPLIDGNGEPVSCARYHSDYVWEQPDLHISFTYNPNHEPPILILPEGYVQTVIDAPLPSSGSSSSASSEASSSSSSAASEASSSSTSSDISSSVSSSAESSVSSSEASSVSSSADSSVSSSASSSLESAPVTGESADPAPAPTETQ